MDSKQDFYKIIFTYYKEKSGEKIDDSLLIGLSETLTEHYFEQYSRFGQQYPKSIKRYSSFQLKDLDHPNTFEKLINFFKQKTGNAYPEFAKRLLDMNDNELAQFEENRRQFYNMW